MMIVGIGKIRFQSLLVLAATLAILAGAPVAWAQTSSAGKVLGTVTDQTGAVVPKAEIQLLNTGTNAAQSAISNDSGEFVFPVVSPGNYKITVKLTGFRIVVVSDITVDVEKTNTIPLKLEVGTDK
jgi:hypothetical protein